MSAALGRSTGEGQIERQLLWAQRPIQHLLDDRSVTDIHINGAAEDGDTPVFLKRNGKRECVSVPLTRDQLASIGKNCVRLNRMRLTRAMPFAPGKLPGKQRVQVVSWPALPEGQTALSIRRTEIVSPTPQMLKDLGVFDNTAPSTEAKPRKGLDELIAHFQARRWFEFLMGTFRHGYSGVLSGSVNTGKTFNLRGLFHAIPLHKRIGTVQDAEELEDMPQKDVIHLLYPKDGGDDRHMAEHCVEACLRMDADEIINSEVRDRAVWALLRAAMGGFPIKTSCHASGAEGTFQSLLVMVKQHPVAREFENDDLLAMLRQVIDFIAFCEDIDGKRQVTQVWFNPEAKRGMPVALANALQGG